MRYLRYLLILVISTLFTACIVTKELTENEFNSGYYKTNIFNNKPKQTYITITADSIKVYPIKKENNKKIVDTNEFFGINLQSGNPESKNLKFIFTKTSFDIDVLTIPFKYRPPLKNFPNQLNTNFNGAFYIGYRADKFRLSYSKTPFNKFNREHIHYGYSFGAFAGFGATAMNPWVTNNQIVSEYDGVVFLKGIGAIIGIENFTFGICLGFDNLLDKNSKFWIYEQKPWLGLALGLNLN